MQRRTEAPGQAPLPNLDDLARRLYEPLSRRIRAELLADQERVGRRDARF